MDRVNFAPMKGLCIAATIATLAGCTGGQPEPAQLADSAALEAPASPDAAGLPVQAESGSLTPAEPSQPARATPARPATTQPGRNTEPVLRQPPPARDTRPSIPYPPDTL